MRRLLRNVLAVNALLLGLIGAAPVAALLPAPAFAQAASAGAGLVELVPAGEVVGDGKTTIKYSMLALGADGNPIVGLKGRLLVTGGAVGPLTDLGNGLYDFTYTPPTVAAPRAVEFSFRGKTLDKVTLDRSWMVTIHPAVSHRITVSANPSQLLLGQDASSTINIQLDVASGESLQDVHLAVAPSAGEVTNLTYLGNGRYTALFTPPKVNYPHVAILAVVDQQDPSRSYGVVSIPLVGKTAYPVTTSPGAKVMLKVGNREFGPIEADAKGQATVPIVVPPGVQEGTLTTAVGSETRQQKLDLKVPEARRIKLFPVHAAVPADKAFTVPVRVAVTTPEGNPASNAQVTVSASVGTVSAPVHEGNGIYRVDFTPPVDVAGSQVTFAATLASNPSVQVDKVTMPLTPIRPGSVKLTAEPMRLPPGATGFKAMVQVLGPDNVGMGGKEIVFAANGAQLKEPVKDLRSGDYQGIFQVTGTGPVELAATVRTAATGNPFRQLLMLPTADRLPNDGLSSVMLTIIAVDEFGYPVGNVPLTLKAIQGDGSVPSSATTDASGYAQVYYTAGRGAGLVTLQATSADHVAVVSLLQSPIGVASGLKVPRSGSPSYLGLVGAWTSVVQTLRIEREGQAAYVPLAAPVPVPITEAAVAGITLTAEPATVAPGGTVTLRVRVTDATGRGIPGQELDFVSSTGTIAHLADQGGGDYQAVLTVPTSVGGDVKVSVATASGVASFRKIPVAGVAAPPPTSVAQPLVPPPSGVAQPVPRAPPSPPAAVAGLEEPAPAHRWLHLRAAIGPSAYRYAYDVFGTPRYLRAKGDPIPFEESLVLSGDDDAVTVGGDPVPLWIPAVDVRLDGWVPGFEYVGFDLRYRTSWFGVETDSFTLAHEGVDMSWVDSFATATARARYYHDAGPHRFWLGVRGGAVYTAVPLVTEWQPAGEPTRGLWFFPWSFISFYGGGQAGAELGMGLDVLVGWSLGTEAYSGIFCNDLDVEASWEFIDHLSVHLGYDRLARHVVVPDSTSSDDTGSMVEVTDTHSGVFLGVGTAF